MRQIKFRAWDKKGEQMVNHIAELRFDNDTLSSIQSEYDLDIDDGQNSGHYERLCNEIILMQFTGLKDKNGKDIYEGDLVKQTVLGSNGEIVATANVEVIFEGSCYKPMSYHSTEYLEVIGNIYEK